MMTKQQKKYLPWIIWGVGAGFFFVQYLARVSPSIMLSQIMQKFNVNSIDLGGLASAFYLAYVAMQIPSGLLLDRFGVRQLLITSLLCCAFSVVLFSYALHFEMLIFSRILLGLAGAFGFISAVKLATQWFPSNRLGMMVGATQGLGMLGAAVGQAPVRGLMNFIGSRSTLMFIAFLFVLLAILAILFVRNKSTNTSESSQGSSLAYSFCTVLKNPQSWLNAAYVSLLYMPTIIFGEFWGTSFFTRVDNLPVAKAAFSISLIFIGWAIGSLTMGSISDALGRRKPALLFSSLATLLLMIFVLYVHLPVVFMYPLLLIFGFMNAGVAISYTVAGEINPRSVAGTSVAFANMASIILGALMQPVIGWLIHLHWSGQMLNGVPFYTAHDYRFAMSILIVCVFVSFLIGLFIKETHCRVIEG